MTSKCDHTATRPGRGPGDGDTDPGPAARHDERAHERGRSVRHPGDHGVDQDTGRYFVRTIENHGFYRHYDMTVAGRTWIITGAAERALIEFSPDGRTQTLTWEWRPKDRWLPLCDRVAVRED